MIFSLKMLSPSQRHSIQSITTMRPAPQLPVWENMARLMVQKGCIQEACFLIDMISTHYGKQSGRSSAERIFNIKMHQKGRGITASCPPNSHPALFALRDNTAPIQIGQYAVLQSGENILISPINSADFRFLHALSESPTVVPIYASENKPVHWISVDNFLIFSNGTNKITLIDLSSIPEPDNDVPLPHAVLTFDSPVHKLCGPLDDGTFFVTLEPPMPVFSDICRLCSINTAAVHAEIQRAPQDAVDVRAIQALDKDILLTNIEQTLADDCVPDKTHFITCGGGMQNREVRFIASDGSWTTKFIHEAPVIRVIMSEKGPVTLDETGQAYLWDEQNVIGDTRFAMEQLPTVFKDNMSDVQFSIDWLHNRLYMTITHPPQATLTASLKASHSCCLTQDNADIDAFVKKIFHLKDMTLVMLADASIHFWDMKNDCVDVRWQLPKVCAEPADWHALLDARSPKIEEDPRIRIIEL